MPARSMRAPPTPVRRRWTQVQIRTLAKMVAPTQVEAVSATYHFIERLIGVGTDVFYLLGEIPAEGPAIVVANHPNALVDPSVVARLSPRPVRFLAKEPLFRMPVISWLVKGVHALPVYRAKDGHDTAKNAAMFDAVFAALKSGDLICLFPEGIGHHEPELQPLKTGAARMALGAEAEHGWQLGVKLIPVGITFADKPQFRSDCYTEVGEPIVAADFREAYERDEGEAARALTDVIDERLRAVTLNLEQWDDLPLVELAEMLWRTGEVSEHERTHRLRLLADGARRLAAEHPQELDALRDELDTLKVRLSAAGLGPEHLNQRYTVGVLLWFLVRHAFAMVFGLPAVALGALAYALPYLFLRQVPKLMRSAPDMLATQRILGGLVIFPLWHALLTVLLHVFATTDVALTLSIALPFCGLYAHAFATRRRRMFRDALSFLRLLARPGVRRGLVEEQRRVASRIDELAALLS
jgi:glycerol-3-phosphate O-acyltransferase/dihydroxyacetone phosphate acyltransferase